MYMFDSNITLQSAIEVVRIQAVYPSALHTWSTSRQVEDTPATLRLRLGRRCGPSPEVQLSAGGTSVRSCSRARCDPSICAAPAPGHLASAAISGIDFDSQKNWLLLNYGSADTTEVRCIYASLMRAATLIRGVHGVQPLEGISQASNHRHQQVSQRAHARRTRAFAHTTNSGCRFSGCCSCLEYTDAAICRPGSCR